LLVAAQRGEILVRFDSGLFPILRSFIQGDEICPSLDLLFHEAYPIE
jgi:hypothetical protein